MLALITNQYQTTSGQHFEMDVEGTQIGVAVYNDGTVNVCVRNAMHRAYRFGNGRTFDNAEQALASYKSGKARTAIALAVSIAPDFAQLQPTQ